MSMRGFLGIILLFAFATLTAGTQSPDDPKAFWERVIAAKGGRERLHAVTTLVVSVDGRQARAMDSGRPVGEIHNTYVHQLPDRFWLWEDTRPSRRTAFSVAVFNALNRTTWFASAGGAAVEQRYFESQLINVVQRDELTYLLETRFIQPTPAKLSMEPDGKTAVIEVHAPGFAKVTHRVDLKTYLPVESTVYFETFSHVLRIQSYTTIDGLKMPSRISGQDVSFTINPQIDPKLFDTPPDGVTHRDAWKKYLLK